MKLFNHKHSAADSARGDTPREAMADFDNNWWKQKTPEATRIEQKIAEEDAREEEINNGQFGVGA